MSAERDEKIWAAGFFDGEGNTGVWTSTAGKKRLQIQIHQALAENEKSPEVLKRFQRAVGIGKIYGPYAAKNTRSRQTCYYIAYGENAEIAIKRIWKFLSSVKQEQIREMRGRL